MEIDSSAHAEATTYASQALDSFDRLNELHADRSAPGGNARAIGAEHQRLGLFLKMADVHATLAVAEELAEIRRLMISGAVTL